MSIHTILVPVDFSSHSNAALDFAVNLAKQMSAEIHVVHAYQLPYGVTLPYDVVIPQEIAAGVRDAATERVGKLCERVRAQGVDCTPHVLGSVPVDAILETSKGVKADLVVLGTRGLTGIKHALLGSVAERIVRLATCPVLTVKSEEEEE